MTISSITNAPPAGFPSADGQLGFVHIGSIKLESGVELPDVTLALQRWGELSPARDNVVLIEHALTGDSHVVGSADDEHPSPGWWNGMIGPGAPIDTNEWCVVATNVLGGCRGTTGPGSLAADGAFWGSRFPEISIRDQVTAEVALADVLGIESFAAVVGGSMGGMRALEWIVGHPHRVDAALVLAVSARATADQIGTQTAQIEIIKNDPDWQDGDYHGTGRRPTTGLGLARRIAHMSYRSESELDSRFANDNQTGENPWAGGRYAVQSYLEYQADKLVSRFDAGTYVLLTESLNRHDVGRGRGGVAAALGSTEVPVIVGGVDSDRLYPLRLLQELADGLAGCDGLRVVESKDGHDGFLTESDAVAELLKETAELAREARRNRVSRG
ncbi:homoserine O-acetyltransferase MetX [Rhodococcus spongiicola]|uniref:homoserine O-acetyltransferase MetX n=1 Tax=Rhodococcus spongiicola TaxID=2487352 RepID=UPI0013E3B531|nr:homoserine O-acetyltransferase [Rhodococcus spongiicola]